MTSPFWHTQHGVNSPIWQTEPTRRRDSPTGSSQLRRTNTPSRRRTRVETQCRPPVSSSSRPSLNSRYTSPEDESKTTASSTLPSRSSRSPRRVYSSSSQPYDQCRSPVMTLRILSPSRHSARDEKSQSDHKARPVQQSPESPPGASHATGRMADNKLTSPKRRRHQLRDSILLKRRDSPDSSKPPVAASANTSKRLPETPEERTESSWLGSLPAAPVTPSKSRLRGFPKLAAFSRDPKPARLPDNETGPSPHRDEPEAVKKQAGSSVDIPHNPSGHLVSRICTMILDEDVSIGGANVDRSSLALKVWDAVVKCLDDISQAPPHEPAGKPQFDSPTTGKDSPASTFTASSTRNPWPLEAWGYRHGYRTGSDGEGRRAGEVRKEKGGEKKPELLPLSTPAEQWSDGNSHTPAPPLPLPCPFRTRNPARFNVNDSWHCAQGQWTNLSELQQHIAKHHRHPNEAYLFQCPRCDKGFSEPKAFKDHLMLPREQMCDPRSEGTATSNDPEDGITAGRARALSEGVERGKIGSWDDLWKCLFPTDRMVPRPAILPAIELAQVEQEVFASNNMSSLKANLEERLKFLASQSSNSEMFMAQMPVITGSISLVVEAHLRSVFINCRSQTPARIPRLRSTSLQAQRPVNNRPRNLSWASSAGIRNIEKSDHPRPATAANDTKALARGTPRPYMHNRRSHSDGASQVKALRAATLPAPSTLTIPFPRISVLTEQSDLPPSNTSEKSNTSPKHHSSDAEYSSGVESNPTSAGGLRDSNNTDIRCSKCNIRPSLRPDEEVFHGPHTSVSSTQGTQGSSCRFSDSGIGILCRNCRMLEELINSYSRTSSQSAKSDQRAPGGPGPPEVRAKKMVLPFSPNPSDSLDENDEETLFDLILDSATYVDDDGQRKTHPVSPMFPPPRQDLPQSPLGKYDRYRNDGNFF
ncbi:uncharacterized protein CTRU02_201217 [Colletotrichum truncatum]|uniref:Uncharacterized protein n=1 Tax=Colletotrichum truncatum TaxID=5467 RepID=A0ACC3ZGS7_COLTU|nr:uncharacterized protein CTRU02_08006 [Colletotrichum truncatum]KAF6790486.1 hypothetical protein CTRU02_08006 [Colletotrichum truncatum]